MLVQAHDGEWPLLASQQEVLGKYFPLMTFAHKALGFSLILQNSLITFNGFTKFLAVDSTEMSSV